MANYKKRFRNKITKYERKMWFVNIFLVGRKVSRTLKEKMSENHSVTK